MSEQERTETVTEPTIEQIWEMSQEELVSIAVAYQGAFRVASSYLDEANEDIRHLTKFTAATLIAESTGADLQEFKEEHRPLIEAHPNGILKFFYNLGVSILERKDAKADEEFDKELHEFCDWANGVDHAPGHVESVEIVRVSFGTMDPSMKSWSESLPEEKEGEGFKLDLDELKDRLIKGVPAEDDFEADNAPASPATVDLRNHDERPETD